MFAALASQPLRQQLRSAEPRMESISDLETLAPKLNPKVGFWDPLSLSSANFWNSGEEATVGWLRHAEIKHGRVAMFAFVGYCVQANGIYWPWKESLDGTTFAQISAAGSPPEQFDALPTLAKVQILFAISLFELFGERSDLMEEQGEKHYMQGGKPGFYPSIKNANVPHPVPLDLYDPFGFAKKSTPEKKARGLLAEINNGRLAMLGIMGFLAEAKVPGSVPALTGIVKPYAGEPMGFFTAADKLPFVDAMAQWDTAGVLPFKY
tara:strand:- start:1132 stop:1926 length:795 start_codon:yes stop_codon:yes gene_type:complete